MEETGSSDCKGQCESARSKQWQGKLKLDKLERLSQFSRFSKFVDTNGRLNFAGKAVLHESGVDFSNGISYSINLDDLAIEGELGKGQYGVVKKVYHVPTRIPMAMKETLLELDKMRLNQILMELDVLHKSQSPRIVEFYGAFFVESRVYYCMEYMDAGSLEKLYAGGLPEPILARVATCMIEGLKFLKEELSIMHRDVKPTNVLLNTQGQVKLCDFGISGNLVMSLAKTDIGCRNYMAPERITTKNLKPYTVQADVWSLGLSLLEAALGRYPYSSSENESLLVQLNHMILGTPPPLPEDKFSKECQDFISLCMHKEPECRPSYAELLNHFWIQSQRDSNVNFTEWVKEVLEKISEN